MWFITVYTTVKTAIMCSHQPIRRLLRPELFCFDLMGQGVCTVTHRAHVHRLYIR